MRSAGARFCSKASGVPPGSMLSFGTGKKKKRNWREALGGQEEGEGAAAASAQGDDGDSEEAIDEAEIEAQLAEEAKIEAAEEARLSKIKADADARRAIREQKKRELREAQEKEEAAKKAKTEEAASRAEESTLGGIALSAYREKRVIVVTNLSTESTEDDIRMLMEGYGRIRYKELRLH